MKVFAAVAAGAVLAIASTALAQGDIVEDRQKHMKAMGGAMKTIGEYVKGAGPGLDDVKTAAATLNERARFQLDELFPENTAVGTGDSAARPEIWQDWAKFEQASATLRQASGQLHQAALNGDEAAVRSAFPTVGKACGGCHEQFRVKKD